MQKGSRAAAATATLVLGALLTAAPSSVAAAEREDPETLIREGVALRKAGEDLKAHGYFQRAYDLAHTPRTAAQLGLCELAVGEWLDAEVHLGEALTSSDPWVKSQKSVLETSRSRARTKLGKIHLSGAPTDASVSVDQRSALRLSSDGDVWANPGAVRLRIEAPGYQPVDDSVNVMVGRSATISISMAPAMVRAPVAANNTEPSTVSESGPVARPTTGSLGAPEQTPRLDNGAAAGRSNKRGAVDSGDSSGAPAWRLPVVLSSAGLAVVSLGIGLYEHQRYDRLTDDFNDTKVRTPPCAQTSAGTISGGATCLQLANDGDSAKLLTIVGYAGAAALLVTATIIFFATSPSGSTTTAMACAPTMASPDSPGLACGLRF